jgi:hypothetical protein
MFDSSVVVFEAPLVTERFRAEPRALGASDYDLIRDLTEPLEPADPAQPHPGLTAAARLVGQGAGDERGGRR